MREFSFCWSPFDTDEVFEVSAVYWPPVKSTGEFWGTEYDDSDPAEITIKQVLNSKGKMVSNYEQEEIEAAAFEAYEKQLQEID